MSLWRTAMGTMLDLSVPAVRLRTYSNTSAACWTSWMDSAFNIEAVPADCEKAAFYVSNVLKDTSED